MSLEINIRPLAADDFNAVIAMGNLVHGDNYLDQASMQAIYQRGLKLGLNASFVAYDGQRLVGFRLTYAPGNWEIDHWCTPNAWRVTADQCCYFKCNTIDSDYRQQGIGSRLLRCSAEIARQQGATAGISHVWMQSPGNAAFGYFCKSGGHLVNTHADRWNDDCITDGYICTICGNDCHCDAGEMILYFDEIAL